jgi:hypothetical protein
LRGFGRCIALAILGAKEVRTELQRGQYDHDDARQNEERAGALADTAHWVAGRSGIGFSSVFAPKRSFGAGRLRGATGGGNEIGLWT